VGDGRSNGYLAFKTNDTERMRIFANGNVAIGSTTDAGFLLDVTGTARINSDLRVNATTGFNTLFTQVIGGGGIGMVSTTDPTASSNRLFSLGFGSVNYPAQARIEAYATEAWTSTNRGSYLTFRTTPTASAGAQDRMMIGNNGFVGINTLTPLARLHVAGNMLSDNDAYFATASGNVGIGTASPSARVENYTSVGTKPTLGDVNSNYNIISGDIRTGTTPVSSSYATTLVLASNTDTFSANNGGSIGFQGKWNSALYSSQAQFSSIFGGKENSTDGNLAGYLSIATRPAGGNPIERVRVNSAGNVGIGTTNPSVNLQIGDIASGSGQRTLLLTDPNYGLRLQGGGGPSNSIIQSVGSGVNLIFRSSNGNNTNYIFDSTGNTLFGTTTDSGQKVQINSSLRMIPTSTVPTASAGTLYYDTATNKLKLYDGTSWVDLN
jgi:hypothetical protein